ncbi:8-amino-7-oxononanoate synthase [Pyruvatibacter mobilis]|uniref:8-amino-7-oxononanoate synthase n=1 Tax=Pyruvatibacter mobilis TaxID=1712261 RepID=UPI003BAC77F7
MPSLNQFASRKLAELETRGQRRELVDTGRGMAGRATRDGRDVISFCCNDYLNLSQHPQVKAAAAEALETYGAGTGASRLVTGNNPLFAELEARLARIKGAEAALIFGSGYLANTGIIPSLLGEGDIIFADELSHACIISGARMSRARVIIFRHNDMAHLRSLLAAHRAEGANALVVTDGVFSMDGDLAPLPEMTALAEAHDAWLMTDDAHGLGVIGGGRGSSFAFGPQKMNVPLQMGTLSKAVGGYGGYLCADQPVIDLLKSRARTLVYSTGLPPASVAAALAALDVIEAEPERVVRPVANATQFCREVGLPTPESPIVPVIIGEETRALDASRLLLDEGYLVTAIRPPTVPPGTARLRLTFMAEHNPADITRLASLVRDRIIKRPAA